jgi:hypothetical protein
MPVDILKLVIDVAICDKDVSICACVLFPIFDKLRWLIVCHVATVDDVAINAWFVEGVVELTAIVDVDVVNDVGAPVDIVAFIQFVPLYCKTWLVVGELIDTLLNLFIVGNVPFIVKFPPLDKLISFVEL